MHKPETSPIPSLTRREIIRVRLRHLLFKRVWLPRFIYEALPLIYIGCGLVALAAALFLPVWAWIFPWAVVFGFAAVHLGIGIAALRHKFRRASHSVERKIPRCKLNELH